MRRVVSLGAALTLLAVIALLAGCGGSGASSAAATATSTTAPTPTPVLNATYTSADGVYKLNYPSSWKVEPLTVPSTYVTSGTVEMGSSDANDIVLVEPFTVNVKATYPAILKAGLTGSKFTNSKVDAAVTTQTYPSGTWTVASGTTEVIGTPMTVHLYGIVHNNKTFIIFTLALPASATADQATYFDPMLTSLVFLK
jgi:ABC-type glycerol-3-phosphate transport system substrate-binding protein